MPEIMEPETKVTVEPKEPVATIDPAELSKAKQRADMEAANARKAREQVQGLQTQTQTLQRQLADLQAKAKEQNVEIPDLKEDEYQDTDVPIVRAIKALSQKINAKDEQLEGLRTKLSALEQERTAEQERKVRDSVYEDILSDLDTEYGPENRNAAVKQFNKLVESGEVPQNNPAKATRMMEKCYKDAKKARETAIKKGEIVLDAGVGGGGNPKLTPNKLKEGSLNEVLEQIKQRKK